AEANNCVVHIFSLGLPRVSDLRQAAIRGDLAGGHEAAVLRREKGGHRPDLRRIGHALKRIERGEDLHCASTGPEVGHSGIERFLPAAYAGSAAGDYSGLSM